ncbi:unnamed protein product [Acanthoscelides obtectus]|uniref:Endoplasmic reticulum lectin 1 n=1 Tax=Acanthoscelides obtectus TaxID=200917 RepID=A0A9P0LXM8_ACAOB|nr:unnamed protein product [Acanthoscelides obtectus]CAK1659253.1 Endoplasmic reticulum lectin 1 [Acanthoscelides obtectus]
MYRLLILVFLCKETLQSDVKTLGFDDTLLFDINWPGQLTPDEQASGLESIIVTSSHKEKYKCIIPNIEQREDNSEETYEGPTAFEIIAPLFTQATCSFRLESYWTYEVCHGRYIRQYHEDREGKALKIQEYILGKLDAKQIEILLAESKIREEKEKVPFKKIDNVYLPYYEVTMDNGTFCDLNNNKPRVTKVLYVCYLQGKHEIYSLKEISTCVYEIIILSPLLCSHPKYKPKETGERKINCAPIDGSYKKPYNLAKLAHDSAIQRSKSDLERFRLVKIEKEEPTPSSSENKIITDTTPIINFLNGKTCLYGGTGWWKYEFCYGRYVEQFHVEKDGKRVSINLGRFDATAHLEWLKNNPHKRPRPVEERKQLSHFYSGGSICDKTGKPRQTEVRLKCLQDTPSQSTVSLFLLEPKYCQYILGVESPLICNILPKADENGLVSIEDMETEDPLKTKILL